MKKYIIAIIVIFLANLNLVGQIKYYVSPHGNDNNQGSENHPFASLDAARNAIREYKNNHEEPIGFTVTITDGTYYLTEPFVLKTKDSGTKKFPITYKAAEGATPTFSGGKMISGFTKNENGIWEVKIPECQYYNWRFDQLYVNNKRATIAKSPNSGFLKIDSIN